MMQSVWIETVPDQLRFQPLQKNAVADFAIIGGGIVGLLAAFHLTQKGHRVVLIEKNHLATGDTGLTTGFLTRVPDTSMSMIEKRYGLDFGKQLFEAMRSTQQELFALIQNEGIACDFSLCTSNFGSYMKNDTVLQQEWQTYKEVEPQATFVENEKSLTFPFIEAIRFQNEGRWHARKFLLGLAQKIIEKGGMIFEESEAVEITVGEKISVQTPAGTVTAGKLLLAMGNASKLFPELSSLVVPKISYVMAARYEKLPVSNNLFWDTGDPYFYYRTVGTDTIIVGGADIDVDKIHTQKPFEKLENFLKEHLPGNFEITHTWSGTILHTEDGLPYIFTHPHSGGKIFVATGFGGNGMIGGALAGKLLSDLAQGQAPSCASLFSLSRTKKEIPIPVKKSAPIVGAKKFIPFAAVADFNNKKLLCKMIEGRKIVAFKIGEKFFALENECSHAGGSLCDGTLDGNTIECPLHGAQFDVTTGQVARPPAVRAQKTYPTKIENGMLSVEVMVSSSPTASTPSIAPKKPTYWRELFVFSFFAVLFWSIEFFLQYFWLSEKDFGSSFLRSCALTGMSLISAALFSSAIFRWFPKTAKYWRLRRHLGVAGFVFIAFHAWGVYHFIFDYQLKAIYFSWNPIKNPVVFGTAAFPIFFIMAATSTDWAMNKLTPKIWKFIHRFVYIAYLSAVFHVLTINPALLKNPPGYFMLGVTALAVFGELFWFFKTAAKKRFLSLGSLIGFLLIALAAILGSIIIFMN